MKLFFTTLATSLILSVNTFASQLPPAFDAVYLVKKGGMTLGTTKATLRFDDQQYLYQKQTKATGLASFVSGDTIDESSQGQINQSTIKPSKYFYHHKSKKKDRTTSLQFSEKNVVTGQHKQSNVSLKTPNNVLDRASLEIALARDLTSNKQDLSYWVVEKDSLKKYDFQVLGNETLTMADQEYLCKKIAVERKGGDRKTIFWLAQDLNYLPAKIEHTEKGKTLTSYLKRFNSTP